MARVKDLTGQRFGKLTVIKQVGFTQKNSHGSRYATWLCKCDCGNEVVRPTDNLKRRTNHTCGCANYENLKRMSQGNITHGASHTRLYGCYKAMKSRCYRKKDVHYNAYGGRGILICDEWLNDSKLFIDWALNNGYSDDLTIDRIDVNGDYEPSNCRWIPMSEQYKNKQSNSAITRAV